MKKLSLLLLCIPMILSGCGTQSAAVVDTYIFEKQEITESFRVNGTVRPADSYEYAETELKDCIVSEIYVRIGSKVKSGDKICSFDVSKFAEQIEELENKIEIGKSQYEIEHRMYENRLSDARTGMNLRLEKINNSIDSVQDKIDSLCSALEDNNNAKKNAEEKISEIRNLMESETDESNSDELSEQYDSLKEKLNNINESIEEYSGMISESRLELADLKNEYESVKLECEREIASAKADLESCIFSPDITDERQLNKLKGYLEHSVLYSQADGIVSRLNIEKGKCCSDGNAAEILTTNETEIFLSVPDEYILRMKEGDSAEIMISAVPDNCFYGKIREISRFRSENGFDVYVSMENGEGLYDGMSASVSFTEKTVDTFAVPVSAVTFDQYGKTVVYTLVPDSEGYIVRAVNVTLGIGGSKYTEIITDKLKEGDMIVTDPEKCYNGMKAVPSGEGV